MRAKLASSRVMAGAVPVEGLALAHPPSRGRVLVGVALLLLGWTIIGGVLLLPFEDGWKILLIGSLSSAVGMWALLEQAVGRWRPTAGPRMVLSDGRHVSKDGFGPWMLALTLPQLLAMGVLPACVALAWMLPLSSGSPSWLPLLICVPGLGIVLLQGWGTYAIFQRMRLMASLHFEPREHLLPRVLVLAQPWLGVRQEVGVCVALARLWSGEAEQAERELAGLQCQEAHQLLAWFQAGRGEADPAWTSLDPEPLGDRYRWSVALCLAALQSGQPERLRERVSDFESLADALPNRFGTLLRHLARRVRGDRSPVDEDLAWLGVVWPFAA